MTDTFLHYIGVFMLVFSLSFYYSNLKLEQVRHARNLRSSSTINLVIPYASDTFQYSGTALFNSLPSSVKCCDIFKSFSKQTLRILRERFRNKAE